MYHALLGTDYDAGLRLRVAVSGGAAMPAEIMRRFEERFAVPILEGYGLSETSPIATFNRVDRPRKQGSIGLPVWGVEVDVVDASGKPAPDGEPGEIVIRGHNVMKGYFGRPKATTAAIDGDGWFRTGDIGTRDADGYFYVVDRKKDMIIRGGFNVYPCELEEVLLTHPQVSLSPRIARLATASCCCATSAPGRTSAVSRFAAGRLPWLVRVAPVIVDACRIHRSGISTIS